MSLGSEIITTNNTEILITSIGEGILNQLTCHTDLVNCCRAGDTGTVGMGEWHYPDGRAVLNNAAREDFYRIRNAPQVVRLGRRLYRAQHTTGLFCCVIPTSLGKQILCANLGEPHSLYY